MRRKRNGNGNGNGSHATPPELEPPMSDERVLSYLKQLAELRDQGILTEEEFTLQKTRALSA